jgi:hypothetical protein
MHNPLNHPFLILGLSLAAFFIASEIGAWFHQRTRGPTEGASEDFKFVLGATLTLLGLIIGFTFSMAVSRYDLRKNYEEQEANAIGTEYVRADLMPAADGVRVRDLLTNYLDLRIRIYRSPEKEKQIEAETARMQAQLWTAITGPSLAQPNPISALVVSGMNDVLNSQSYAQAARWNRIPAAAWALLGFIAIFCNVLIGYGAQGRSNFLLAILPIVLAISFFIVADIDSPRGGFIRVHPQNLESLAESLRVESAR